MAEDIWRSPGPGVIAPDGGMQQQKPRDQATAPIEIATVNVRAPAKSDQHAL